MKYLIFLGFVAISSAASAQMPHCRDCKATPEVAASNPNKVEVRLSGAFGLAGTTAASGSIQTRSTTGGARKTCPLNGLAGKVGTLELSALSLGTSQDCAWFRSAANWRASVAPALEIKLWVTRPSGHTEHPLATSRLP